MARDGMFFGLEKVNLCSNGFSSILLPDKEKEEAAEAIYGVLSAEMREYG